METTFERPALIAGDVLYRDDASIDMAIRKALHISQAIEGLMSNYRNLELENPMTHEMLTRFIHGSGPGPEIEKFRSILEKDAKKFSSPISRKQLLANADDYENAVYESIQAIKDQFYEFQRNTSYKLSCADYTIENGKVEVITDGIEKHFTLYVTEVQARAAQELQKFADSYNRLVDFFKEGNFIYGLGTIYDHFCDHRNSIVQAFFKHEVIAKATQPGQLDRTNAYIELNKNALAPFK